MKNTNFCSDAFQDVRCTYEHAESRRLTCLPQFGANFDARERLITDCPRIIA